MTGIKNREGVPSQDDIDHALEETFPASDPPFYSAPSRCHHHPELQAEQEKRESKGRPVPVPDMSANRKADARRGAQG
jgi:hypothetical protein